MDKQTRRRFTAEQKATILRRHLVDKVPVSQLCDEYKLQPSVFYGWERQVLDNMAGSFELGPSGSLARERELERKLEAVEARLAKKDAVIAEISAEYVALKKEAHPGIGWDDIDHLDGAREPPA